MSLRALAWALQQSGLRPTDKLLLIALADCTDGDGQGWSSHESLILKTGLSREAVDESLERLTLSGHLEETPSDTGFVLRMKKPS